MLKILINIIFLFLANNIIGQNQANVWHFGKHAGVDFNTGESVAGKGPYETLRASAVMCDSLGNLLFSTNAEKIYNRNDLVMQNGDGLEGHNFGSQAALIIQKPGSQNLYYVFTTGFVQGWTFQTGLYYSVVDMGLDGSLGGVTDEKNVLLSEAWDAVDKIVAARHGNGRDVWVVARKFNDDGYAAFLVTGDGVPAGAVFSPSIDRGYKVCQGNMKISPDKKHLVAAYFADGGYFEKPDIEICSFNDVTGDIDLLYTLRFYAGSGLPDEPWGVEFSPDSKYLYLSIFTEGGLNVVDIYQLDMRHYEDSAQFFDTRIKVAEGVPGLSLQLARDGKIYCTGPDYGFYDYLSVINRPWERGTACQYQQDAVYLDYDGQGRQVGEFLPNILVDYLYRFGWQGRCSSQAFTFKPNF
ncbi:MAG: hypothetical protein GXO88_15500, partial [Chlorobi bacterium]|nr:hypothetical protein [Chlorobiota bacterium]